MNVPEAKELLSACIREELRDHAFGNAEVSWQKGDKQIAGGYFGAGNATIWISSEDDPSVTLGSFEGDKARELRQCGTEGRIERDDETGPDIYVEGAIMPGLTLEGVRKEITTPPSKWDQTNEMVEVEMWDS